MLRVLSLGHSLSQSTPALQPFRNSKWDLSSNSLRIFQVRLVSDLLMKSEETQESKNTHDNVQEGESGRKHESKSGIPSRFLRNADTFRQAHLRKGIRPLRLLPSRPPPKYSSHPELPSDTLERADTLRHLRVHPIHQSKDCENAPTLPKLTYWPGRGIHARHPEVRNRDALLRVLSTTRSVSKAWDVYETLVKRPRFITNGGEALRSVGHGFPLVIPYQYLHRLARLLSSTRPRTRRLFLRLLSVLTTLRETGGIVFLWEWNALIDCAGKGWRKTTLEDYRSALGIFKEMVTLGETASYPRDLTVEDEKNANRPVAKPDIYTFTSLLNIASRSLSEKAIHHATSLLNASELPWNNVTHMARLPYLIRTQQFHVILGILQNALYKGLDLITINGCLWAYARNGQLRVALEVYELLRCNIPAQDRTDFSKTDPGRYSIPKDKTDNPILNLSHFVLPDTMCPDKITYSLLIQATSYHGDFISAMRIFRDMISTTDPTTRILHQHPTGRRPQTGGRFYKPTLSMYRAIFLGFARHAETHQRQASPSMLITKGRKADDVPLSEFAARLTPSYPGAGLCPPLSEKSDAQMHWTLENLEALFESFLEIGWGGGDSIDGLEEPSGMEIPSERTIYWIMVAYAKVTRGDVGKMYKAWLKLDERFGARGGFEPWKARIASLSERLESRYRRSRVVENEDPEMDPNG